MASPPSESGGLSGGAVFGIVFTCLLVIGGVVLGMVIYKRKILDPREREKDLLHTMLSDAKKPRQSRETRTASADRRSQLESDRATLLPQGGDGGRSNRYKSAVPQGAPELGVC